MLVSLPIYGTPGGTAATAPAALLLLLLMLMLLELHPPDHLLPQY
jgi:hypothetical protein